MKYIVDIVEHNEGQIEIEATSRMEAEDIASTRYYNDPQMVDWYKSETTFNGLTGNEIFEKEVSDYDCCDCGCNGHCGDCSPDNRCLFCGEIIEWFAHLVKRTKEVNGMDDRHVVWSNENLDLEDWRADLEEEYPGYSDDELYEIMCDTNSAYLSDERVNLNIQLSQPILVVADLGLWDGRRMGYKEIESGNIRDCLYSNYDYTTWYVDKNGDFRCDDVHHDGTNHYLYRVYKDNISESQKDRLKEKIYDGTATRADIVRITRRLGDEIGKVYGWTFPTYQRERGEAR